MPPKEKLPIQLSIAVIIFGAFFLLSEAIAGQPTYQPSPVQVQQYVTPPASYVQPQVQLSAPAPRTAVQLQQRSRTVYDDVTEMQTYQEPVTKTRTGYVEKTRMVPQTYREPVTQTYTEMQTKQRPVTKKVPRQVTETFAVEVPVAAPPVCTPPPVAAAAPVQPQVIVQAPPTVYLQAQTQQYERRTERVVNPRRVSRRSVDYVDKLVPVANAPAPQSVIVGAAAPGVPSIGGQARGRGPLGTFLFGDL